MKSLVVFAAVLGLPLCALAQPTADDSGKPADLSGLTVRARCPVLPDSQWPSTVFDAPARVQRTQPSPGTREFLEREVALIESQGVQNYAQMDAPLERVMRGQARDIALLVNCHGALKSITFLHVSEAGYDDYEVAFADGALEWEVAPLDAHQMVHQMAIRYFRPRRATR